MSFLKTVPLLSKLLLASLLVAPQGAISGAESSKIAEALKRAYVGSRYDIVEASVNQCRITVSVRDSDACDKGATIQSVRYFYDLRHHQARFLNKNAREIDGMWRFHILLSPVGEWEARTFDLKAKAKIRRQAAIEKYGRGKEAAIASSQEFLLNNSVTDFFSSGTTEYCPSGKVVGPFGPTLLLQGPDVEELVEEFETLISDCALN